MHILNSFYQEYSVSLLERLFLSFSWGMTVWCIWSIMLISFTHS